MEYLIIATASGNPQKRHYVRTDTLDKAFSIATEYEQKNYKTEIRAIEPKAVNKDFEMVEYLLQKYGGFQSLGVLYEKLKFDKHFLK